MQPEMRVAEHAVLCPVYTVSPLPRKNKRMKTITDVFYNIDLPTDLPGAGHRGRIRTYDTCLVCEVSVICNTVCFVCHLLAHFYYIHFCGYFLNRFIINNKLKKARSAMHPTLIRKYKGGPAGIRAAFFVYTVMVRRRYTAFCTDNESI